MILTVFLLSLVLSMFGGNIAGYFLGATDGASVATGYAGGGEGSGEITVWYILVLVVLAIGAWFVMGHIGKK